MSRGRICDQCGTVLTVDRNGDDMDGESAAWMVLTAGRDALDLCSRSCAHELLDSEEFVTAYEGHVETIVGVARAIRGDEEDDGE